MTENPARAAEGACLLVVDDQKDNIEALVAMLGKQGFEILTATGGEQALGHLAVRQPDLILLDMLMPGVDGLGLCRKIQENEAWSEIPIIFLSAADDKDLIVRALESGGMDYITKPFNQHELITRVRTHLSLKAARDNLKRLAQDKEEMLGMISHQLQNHFAGTEMSAQVLLKRAPAEHPVNARLLMGIRDASNRMRGFVRSFLANSAAEHRLSIKLEPVCLARIASEVIEHYQPAAHAKEIKLLSSFPEGSNLVHADPTALTQVLDNLVSNAVKFSPARSEVSITVQANTPWMECRVRDQGVGFTKEDSAAMFGRYARLSARPTAGEPSTGLGLNIARKLTHAMGGELICESEPGKGATFILRLRSATHNTSG